MEPRLRVSLTPVPLPSVLPQLVPLSPVPPLAKWQAREEIL